MQSPLDFSYPSRILTVIHFNIITPYLRCHFGGVIHPSQSLDIQPYISSYSIQHATCKQVATEGQKEQKGACKCMQKLTYCTKVRCTLFSPPAFVSSPVYLRHAVQKVIQNGMHTLIPKRLPQPCLIPKRLPQQRWTENRRIWQAFSLQEKAGKGTRIAKQSTLSLVSACGGKTPLLKRVNQGCRKIFNYLLGTEMSNYDSESCLNRPARSNILPSKAFTSFCLQKHTLILPLI